MIVVDPSAVLEALLQTPAAGPVESRMFDSRRTLHAPHLLDVEIAHVLRRYAMAGDIDRDPGAAVLADLADLPLRRYSHDFLLPRIWQLRNNLTAYDAVYVALAEALDAPPLTRDKRLPAVAGHHARIELI